MRPPEQRIMVAVAAPMLLPAVLGAQEDRTITTGWYVRIVPAIREQHLEARRQLVRETHGVRRPVADGIGTNLSPYPPDCVAYEVPAADETRDVDFVCGDHRPIRVASLSDSGVRFDENGLRSAPGVMMRPVPGVTSAESDSAPRDFIALDDMHMASLREPLLPVPVGQLRSRATNSLLLGLAVIAALVIGAMYWLRKLRE